jgi:hypothetical protein
MMQLFSTDTGIHRAFLTIRIRYVLLTRLDRLEEVGRLLWLVNTGIPDYYTPQLNKGLREICGSFLESTFVVLESSHLRVTSDSLRSPSNTSAPPTPQSSLSSLTSCMHPSCNLPDTATHLTLKHQRFLIRRQRALPPPWLQKALSSARPDDAPL